jgi:hypothetical protein
LTRPVDVWRDRVFVIAEGSASVDAYNLLDGSPGGSWTLPGEDVRFVTPPRVAEDLVVAAYERYGGSSCRLVGLRLQVAPRG